MKGLTARQKEVLDYISVFTEDGIMRSFEDVKTVAVVKLWKADRGFYAAYQG